MKHLLLIVVGIILLTFSLASCGEDNFEEGNKKYNNEYYASARSYYELVPESSENYEAAQLRISKIDSFEAVYLAKKKIEDSIRMIEVNQKKREQLISELDANINTISDYDPNRNIVDIDDVLNHVKVFDQWKDLIKRGYIYTEHDSIIERAEKLEKLVKSTSKRCFPQYRKQYGAIVKSNLWEEDIDVSIKGRGYKTIEFVGGTFASNSSIKSFQETISSTLRKLRFDKVNYKFTKYDDEYTYYDLNSQDDGEIPE